MKAFNNATDEIWWSILNRLELAFENWHSTELSVFFSPSANSQRFLSKYWFNDKDKEKNWIKTPPVPRLVIQLEENGLAVQVDQKTNPYIWGSVWDDRDDTKPPDKKWAPLKWMPIEIQTTLVFKGSSYTEKIAMQERIISLSDRVMNFYYFRHGIKLDGAMVFPTSLDNSLKIDFSYIEEDDEPLRIPLEIKTFMLFPQWNEALDYDEQINTIDHTVNGTAMRVKRNY